MAKKNTKKPAAESEVLSLSVGQRIDLNCLNNECMAEFCIINEPGRDDSGGEMTKELTALHCPFCGSEKVEKQF